MSDEHHGPVGYLFKVEGQAVAWFTPTGVRGGATPFALAPHDPATWALGEARAQAWRHQALAQKEWAERIGAMLRGFGDKIVEYGATDPPLIRGLYREGWAQALRFAADVIESGGRTHTSPATFMFSPVEMAAELASVLALEARLQVAERELEGLRRELAREREAP